MTSLTTMKKPSMLRPALPLLASLTFVLAATPARAGLLDSLFGGGAAAEPAKK